MCDPCLRESPEVEKRVDGNAEGRLAEVVLDRKEAKKKRCTDSFPLLHMGSHPKHLTASQNHGARDAAPP